MNYRFFSVLFLAYSAMATEIRTESRCKPGDAGPKPLMDISGQAESNLTLVKTVGGISEFAISPSNSSLFYRNASKEIYWTDIRVGASGEHHFFTLSPLPISRVIDNQSRYLLSQGAAWVWDFRNSLWTHFIEGEKRTDPLFWQKDAWGRDWVYSIEEEMRGRQKIYHIYRSIPQENGGYEFCQVKGPELATGHRFPSVFFYQTTEESDGTHLSLLDLDVRRCKFSVQTNFLSPLTGRVFGVHRFDSIESVAVRVDHPTKNLLWHQLSKGCNYFDVGNLEAIIPNPRLPILATWSKETSLNIFNFQTEQRITLFKEAPIDALTREDILVTSDGQKFYVSPQLKGEKSKILMELKISRR